ncbi:ImmA/IrrE family metallo-endopeptidase [Leifsonia sp. 71-9]|uniref:ImmA/IrrE family metallo-endopeptidase n=1 Tax=Leifsonia sp. 71-9 TaxID=1895934 RepID=UPI00092C34B6|nr:ImmA/IrrE family metallo-endopeptidase [Leifsonia sp. 71-9]OJX72801.1 MAG: hypothetical protein BGO91_13605 [Leifsonia sp. 71-9]
MTLSDWDLFDIETYDPRRPVPNSTSYMFGLHSFYDGPCAMDYDPAVHAEDLGIPVIYRSDLPEPDMVAGFSLRFQAIFMLPNLHSAVERCALAHEIVHWERQDEHDTQGADDRADRIAARRLIRPSRIREAAEAGNDYGRIALELNVTEKIMELFVRSYG